MARHTGHTAKGPSQRQLRVGELVRKELSDVLTRGEVSDPELAGIIITIPEVRMTPDLRNATGYVKPLLGRDEDEVVTALRQNTAYLQREVARRLGLKFAPKLKFRPDDSFDEADQIERLLSDPKVARDLDGQDKAG